MRANGRLDLPSLYGDVAQLRAAAGRYQPGFRARRDDRFRATERHVIRMTEYHIDIRMGGQCILADLLAGGRRPIGRLRRNDLELDARFLQRGFKSLLALLDDGESCGKGYSQRDLAALVGVDYTYLSKLENDRADYPPKGDVIQALIEHLDLDADLTKLSYLSGRITPADAKVIQDLAKTYQDKMPVLLRKMQNPVLMQRLLESEDDQS